MSVQPDSASMRRLKRAILDLPRLRRDIFLASRFGGLSYAEIARRTGLTPQEVEQEMAEAICSLAREMSHRRRPWWRRRS